MFNVIDTNLLESDILAASYNNEKGHWDGVLILSNSVYSQIGKSPQEETHFVEKIINHPNYASKIDLQFMKCVKKQKGLAFFVQKCAFVLLLEYFQIFKP